MVREFEDGVKWYIHFEQQGVVYMKKHATRVLGDRSEWLGRFNVDDDKISFTEWQDTYFPFLGEYEISTKTNDLFILKRK